MGSEPSGNLAEVFWSAQGEGPYVGCPTVFIRFGGCDLRCAWCDSPETWRPGATCRFERTAGSAEFETEQNPISSSRVLRALEALHPQKGDFVSFTGGEPLLQPEMVEFLAGASQGLGLRTHLETHGLGVAALERVVSRIDVVAMDWKLASDVRPVTADEPKPEGFGERHELFLAQASTAAQVMVKLVVTGRSRDSEVDDVCERIQRVAPETTLVLQPVTPFGKVRESVPAEDLLRLLKRCRARLGDVRLIPQTHKMYGAL